MRATAKTFIVGSVRIAWNFEALKRILWPFRSYVDDDVIQNISMNHSHEKYVGCQNGILSSPLVSRSLSATGVQNMNTIDVTREWYHHETYL